MLLIADVHGAVEALRQVARLEGNLLVLGDLINLIDYRTNDGIIADVNGREFTDEMVRLRTAGRFDEARSLWRRHTDGKQEQGRRDFTAAVERAYDDICPALAGSSAYVTYGNVDRPDVMQRYLPDGVRFVDAEVLEIEGLRIGFAGGGSANLGIPGEVSEDDMADKLDSLGPVDVLCSHIPPAVAALTKDVIGGSKQGSDAILEYLHAARPPYHYFGDIHQPQATSWQVGDTMCRNVGYFRATGKAVRHG